MGERSVSVQMKKAWKKAGQHEGLREFVKALADAGDEKAKMWFENKAGICNQGRKPENISKATLSAQATRTARMKLSKGK